MELMRIYQLNKVIVIEYALIMDTFHSPLNPTNT